jgi:hypothetical protein
MIMKTIKTTTLLAAAAFGLAIQAQGALLVSESFGGLATDELNGTAADTFSSAITTAGGSSTWATPAGYKADGSIGGNGAAILDLGSYVNDTKGQANGLFTLSVIMDVPASPMSWVSYGFLIDTATTGSNFTSINSAASIIYRNGSGGIDGFAGLKTNGSVDGSSASPSATGQVLTSVLDLTPGGGYNGTTNHGTVSFYVGDDSVGNLIGSAQIGASMDFAKLALTSTGGGTGQVSYLELSQVPEPSAFGLLAGCFGFAWVMLRRRRG